MDRAFERLGWTVVSLDIDTRCEPTHVADILSWDYRIYPRNHFDFVWASPLCQHYSIARTTGGPRDLLSADRLVRRAIEIMNYFECNWAFENPQSGLLKTREIVRVLPFLTQVIAATITDTERRRGSGPASRFAFEGLAPSETPAQPW